MNTIQSLITEHLDIWTAAETEKKSGRGRSSGNAASVYGIKKLRELILELAVRGKLVPQDANDESASELLKRIQAEKGKLIAEGKIKKSKPLAEIADDEKLFELPQGWEWVRFGYLPLDVYTGLDRGKNQQSNDLKYSYFKMNNILNYGGCDISNMVRIDAVSSEINKFSLRNGDFLFNTRNSRELVGKTCVIRNLPEEIVLYNNNILRSQFSTLIVPEFIDYWFRSSSGNQALDKIKSNTTNVCAIYQGNLFNLICPAPSTKEQHRIVAKVDELMALCGQLENQHSNAAEAHEKLVSQLLGTLTLSQSAEDFCANWQRIAAHFDTLFTTEASIDALKQTLLQLAVMGKLVPQDANDEPASELLKRIQAEKAKLVAEGKIKKDKPLPPISDKEKPFELPESWMWVQLGSISEFINGDRGVNYPNRSEYVNVGIPWINTGHIEPDGTLTKLEMNYISREKFNSLNGGKIQLGDLVYCLRGATFGKTAIVDPYFEGAIASSLMIIRPSVYLSKEFMFRYLVSPTGKSQIFRFDNGSAQPNLSANNVKLYVFPLPPISEQSRIVAKVDELMTICDQLKSRITVANQLQQKLADVMVEQAIS